MNIIANGLGFREINEAIRAAGKEITLTGCSGQRFICAGMSDVSVTIGGIPGNALGAYLNGAEITVEGNAQDAVGDTMNDGRIVVHGSIGDAAGYAMRGGCIYVKGDAGYRAGIHMKAYREKVPVMVIGGCAGRTHNRSRNEVRKKTYRRIFPVYRNARREDDPAVGLPGYRLSRAGVRETRKRGGSFRDPRSYPGVLPAVR